MGGHMTELNAGKRLRAYAAQRGDYSIYIAIPISAPESWAKVMKVTERAVVVEDHGEVPLEEVRYFLVAYPNGQLVEQVFAPGRYRRSLPPGVQSLGSSGRPRTDILTAADLTVGKNFIAISHGKCILRPSDPHYYSTQLANVSHQRVRVLRFAAYTNIEGGWKLHTVTRGFYSAEEFQALYGLAGEWIEPGQSVCDANNYGGFPMLWAYYCESADGTRFIAGEVIERSVSGL